MYEIQQMNSMEEFKRESYAQINTLNGIEERMEAALKAGNQEEADRIYREEFKTMPPLPELSVEQVMKYHGATDEEINRYMAIFEVAS